ncbi:MAG: hypothetical protein IJ087_08560 [Eggerthellaceae bacterium]|nr:hypothetical protein [Eggerthellaceae bacterium]
MRLDQKLELAFENLLREEPIGRLPEIYMDVIVRALSSLGSGLNGRGADKTG